MNRDGSGNYRAAVLRFHGEFRGEWQICMLNSCWVTSASKPERSVAMISRGGFKILFCPSLPNGRLPSARFGSLADFPRDITAGTLVDGYRQATGNEADNLITGGAGCSSAKFNQAILHPSTITPSAAFFGASGTVGNSGELGVFAWRCVFDIPPGPLASASTAEYRRTQWRHRHRRPFDSFAFCQFAAKMRRDSSSVKSMLFRLNSRSSSALPSAMFSSLFSRLNHCGFIAGLAGLTILSQSRLGPRPTSLVVRISNDLAGLDFIVNGNNFLVNLCADHPIADGAVQ